MTTKDSIVLYSALGRGHLVSMVELGKLIITHHPSLSINILFLTPPPNQDTPTSPTAFTCQATAKYIAAVTAATPAITFHRIPQVSIPTALPPQALTFELCRATTRHLRRILASIPSLRAVVLDFMNYAATRVTAALNIPTYFYYTSGASTLAVLLQQPTLHENTTVSLKDLNMHLIIPGVPKIHTDDLPDPVKDRKSESYQVYIDIATCLRDSDGVIVNSFNAIEERVVEVFNQGLMEGTTTTPPVFCIGPVISSAPCRKDESECLTWLDSQPSQSVVFLSFGSMGRFSRVQLREIALGLEKSEQRFLWVIRSEFEEGDSGVVVPSLDELLPEGFLERTQGKGFVVRDWAPQAAILSHDSVGGVVTHCGWNSVLEAVCEGVPMVAWPLYAEQRLNRVILVEEMKVGLAVKEGKNGVVSSAELGERVRELMDSDKGKEIRQRIFKMKISATEAMSEGGSSIIALNRLVEVWREH
ncbi:UDP-glycosyltransferase 1-like [Cajanus cajan]|uniref:UDP-glycosyltransferase 1-like n=1 Tax=Cajanus cajan TaxID=3821 RepID=UPI00098D8954|nr:UDP-glycosyltransferase 1-like [Cajanus cajan]